jgi:hypothetical protein
MRMSRSRRGIQPSAGKLCRRNIHSRVRRRASFRGSVAGAQVPATGANGRTRFLRSCELRERLSLGRVSERMFRSPTCGELQLIAANFRPALPRDFSLPAFPRGCRIMSGLLVNEKSLNRKTGKPGRKNPTGRLDRWLAIEPHSHHFFRAAGLRSRRSISHQFVVGFSKRWQP